MLSNTTMTMTNMASELSCFAKSGWLHNYELFEQGIDLII